VTLHDPYADPPAGSPAARRWARDARVFSHVICVSQEGYERQLRYGVPSESLRLVYNGVDVRRFGTGRGDRVRTRLGIGAGTPLVVVSSRLAPQKRPLDALAAFARVAAELPDARLVFLGDGPLAPAVRQEAARLSLSDRVCLPGHQFDVPDWLAAATVWLLPTESEGFSLAVVEAMAAGCAIVSTVCPGNTEVLVDDENALLTAVGDVEAMARALRLALHDGGVRARLGAAARRRAAGYSQDRMVDLHLQCYAEARRPAARRRAPAVAPRPSNLTQSPR
jgi:glycosyltransferase involved in cell wall biosynthesis